MREVISEPFKAMMIPAESDGNMNIFSRSSLFIFVYVMTRAALKNGVIGNT